ncbi:hypothetical protein FPV67DRAFT_1447741 [Lyophyllum atratum]|nr:hypothetical protein FPV67DRAFT_1447741 [Lyophyllum atratum]
MSNPRLCCYIESLSFLLPSFGSEFDTSFPALPNLIRLHTTTLAAAEPGILWPCQPDSFRTAMQELLQLPTLRILYVHNVQLFPTNILRPCFHLEAIHMWGCGIVHNIVTDSPSTLPPSVDPDNRGYLHTVSLYGPMNDERLRAALRDSKSPLASSRLRTIAINICSGSNTDPSRILEITGPYLEQLVLYLDSADMTTTAIDFHVFEKLRIITLELHDLEALLYVERLSESISNLQHLTDIRFFPDDEVCFLNSPEGCARAWRQIDVLLSRKDAVPQLRSVKIVIYACAERPYNASRTLLFQQDMPGLLSNGRLFVERDGERVIPSNLL